MLKDWYPNLTGNVLTHQKDKRSQGIFSHPYKYLLGTNSKKNPPANKSPSRQHFPARFSLEHRGYRQYLLDMPPINFTGKLLLRHTPSLPLCAARCHKLRDPRHQPAVTISYLYTSLGVSQAADPWDWQYCHGQMPHHSSELSQDQDYFGYWKYEAEPWVQRCSPIIHQYS